MVLFSELTANQSEPLPPPPRLHPQQLISHYELHLTMIAHRFLSATTRSLSRRALLSTSFSTTPSTNDDVFSKISFIGTGKMAQAMIAPLITQKLQTPASINAFDLSDEALKRLQELYPGVQVSNSIQDSVEGANLIVYAVKPQNVSKVNSEIRRAKEERGADGVRDDAIILSVAAGTPIDTFVQGSGVEKVARSMPNTPAQIGAGVTVWGCTENINADERKKIKSVLDSFGKSVFVDDESFIDMSTSISGSGPAYIFLLMEAMIDAGVHMGFSRETATILVHHTLLGSTKFAMETGGK